MKIAHSSFAMPSNWIGALCAVLLGSLFLPASAMAMGPPSRCSTSYDRDLFRACFFSGTDPDTGTFLGTEFEPSLGDPVSPRAFGIDRDWGSGEIFGGLSGNISATWRGRLQFGDDRHLLTVFSSDGVRVYIDEELVLDKWDNTGVDTFVVGREGLSGVHNIRIEWFEGDQSANRAHLRFHWDKAPDVYDNLVVSPIKIDVFILEEIQTCIAGEPWDGNPGGALCPTTNDPDRVCDVSDQFRLFNQDGTVDLAWQFNPAPAQLPVALKPSDPSLPTYPLVECLDFGFSDGEISDLMDPATSSVLSMADSFEDWTFGAIQPTVDFHVVEPGEFNMARRNRGLWVSWGNLVDAAEPVLTPESDFVIGLHNVHEVNLAEPNNIRRHSPGAGGLTWHFGHGLPGTGTGYSWVPDLYLVHDRFLDHEWDHQMAGVIRLLMGGGDVTGHPDPLPTCGNGAPNTLEWYPNSHQFSTDPDSPWCGFTGSFSVGRAITSHHLLHHFDPSLAHYTLPYLTGNHCDNGIQDFGETAIDLGAACHLPSVSITSPADESSLGSGESISFEGAATALVEGDLTAGLAWDSDLDGFLGTGGSVVTSMLTTIGTHVITASALDAGGSVGSATITVTVSAVLLSANGYKVKGRHTVDLSWSGAANDVVDIYRDGALVEDNTANDGLYTDATGNKGQATYEYQVCEEAPLTSCSPLVTVVF